MKDSAQQQIEVFLLSAKSDIYTDIEARGIE